MKILIDGRNLKNLTSSSSVYSLNLLLELIKEKSLNIFLVTSQKIDIKKDNLKIINIHDRHNLIWNNFFIPYLAFKYKVNIVFFPKSESCFFPLPGKSIITTIHGMIYKIEPQNNNWYINFYWRFVGKIASIVSKKIICVSKKDYFDLLTENYSKKKLVIIPIGFNKIFSEIYEKNEKEKILEKYNLKDYFIQVGKIAKKKNQLFTLRVLKDFLKQKNIKIVFLGYKGDQDDYSHKVDEYILKNNLKDNVVFTGLIAQNSSEMPILLQNAKISFFPSTYEGFGMPTIESIASGTIILASNTGALPEVLGEKMF